MIVFASSGVAMQHGRADIAFACAGQAGTHSRGRGDGVRFYVFKGHRTEGLGTRGAGRYRRGLAGTRESAHVPDSDRLYALSSTDNNPFRPSESGRGLLINDAVVAMRWYVTSEREENLDVTAHASDDDGATWRPLPVRELLADAERALATAQQAPDPQAGPRAQALHDALAAEAADWLDHRLRYVQPDDPIRAAGRSGLSPSVR